MTGLRIGAPGAVPQADSGKPDAGQRAGRTAAKAPRSFPADDPAPRSTANDGSARAAADARCGRAAQRSASAGPEPAAPASNAGKRDAVSVDRDRDADARDDFATLLAASSPVDANAAASPSPLPVAAATTQADDSAPPATELPDQFLALLSGTWALPVAAATAADGGPGAAGGASPAPLRPAMVAAGGPPLTIATVAAANPGGEAPAALAALVASGSSAGAGRDAGKPGDDGATAADAVTADSFTLAATTPAPAALRATLSVLPPTTPLALPADPDAGFDDGFGARIAWMAEQRLGHAQIRLNPEHVGPIDVRVRLDGDRVSAEFSSAHSEVRQAIEASLPRLRDMLGQHGLQLGQANVGHGRSGRGGDPGNAPRGDSASGAEDGLRPAAAAIRTLRGLLDEYA